MIFMKRPGPVMPPKLLAAIFAMCALVYPASADACILSASVNTDMGTYSPSAVKAKAVPALQSRGGLICDSSLMVLLGGNYIRAKFASANGFKMLRTGGGSVAYKASADAGGTYQFAQGATIDYMQNNLLNLLGLLGGSSADLPFFIKPDEATLPPVGVYKDKITITWNWDLCPGGIKLLGVCVGVPDVGTGASVIDVTLSVTSQNATMTMTSSTTWDPVNLSSKPKAIPGSRYALSATFTNPDIVPLDPGIVVVIVPTPAGAIIALDGDMATAGAPIKLVDGATPSSLTATYTSANDTSDDVDFSSDQGATWTYAPVSGNIASEASVTHVRVKAKGTMAKMSSFAVRIPYLVQ